MRTWTAAIGASMVASIAGAACGSSGHDDPFGSDGTSGGTGFADAGQGPCEGLACHQIVCGGESTSLAGTVYDPSGTVPLYNALVYVPNAELAPFAPGVSCDRCGSAPSGNPIATALTDSKGQFVLRNVPAGVEFPVVVQIGRWRRKVVIPAITACQTHTLAPGITRLPRSKAEGEIPRIALTTGGADSLECFVRKLGLEDGEFSNPNGSGSVHLYVGRNSETDRKDGARLDAETPDATALWDDAAKLKTYDMVILSCEGSENGVTKSPSARENMKAYLDEGGRVFASHFHYVWFRKGPAPLPTTADWVENSRIGNGNVTVNVGFAKGQALSDWLDTVTATTAPQSNTVAMTELRRNVSGVPARGAPPNTSTQWLYRNESGEDRTKFFSFNAPIGAPAADQCGRGVYTDIHVSSGDAEGGTFPGNCTTSGFTPQEKALLFLLMDLASCIQDETKPPAPPPVVK